MGLDNLKAELKRRRITHAAVAEHLGMSLNNLGLKVNEKVRMTLDEAKAIRDEFFPGVPLDYLFQSDGDAPSKAESLHAQAGTMASTITVKPYDQENADMRVAYLQGVIMPNGEFVSRGLSLWVTDDEKQVNSRHAFAGCLFEEERR